jgi:fructokinase
METKVLCFGEVLWDAFGDGKKAGGAPMNVAMHLKKHGISSLVASSVGMDKEGEELVNYLKDNELYSELIQRDHIFPTCLVTVKLDAKQQATYTIPEPVSWDNIKPCQELHDQVNKASAIVYGSLACRLKTSRATLFQLIKLPLLKVFDVNLRPPHYDMSIINQLAQAADILKMNEEELNLISGSGNLSMEEKMRELQQRFKCETICVTCGESGAVVLHHHTLHKHPGFIVEVADTVGAGDAFLASFIAGFLNKESMDHILENACATGAFVASKRGANPDYNIDSIKSLLYKEA